MRACAMFIQQLDVVSGWSVEKEREGGRTYMCIYSMAQEREIEDMLC